MDNTLIAKQTQKFSYSKLNTYESCPWRYKLQYIDHHFVDTSAIANEFGTLVHFIEETIAKDLIANNHEPYFLIDDEKYIDIFINAGCEGHAVQDILGAKKLKEKYPQDFEMKDKHGFSYDDKANYYLNFGIYRLRDFIANNRNIEIVGVEVPFDIAYEEYIFHGFIDRVLRDKTTGDILIEDIKTWQKIDGHDIVTPLQFVFYAKAASEMYNVPIDSIQCFYELPLASERHAAGTKGFIRRGDKKIHKLLSLISEKEFTPKPTPLCYWCAFSDTNPQQPDEGKNLCPYRSNWTKSKKDFSVDFEWMGIELHEQILEAYKAKHGCISMPVDIRLPQSKSDRITLIRRVV